MEFIFLILIATIFLAYSNGANDNFKGVATLFGSGTVNYKLAIWFATITTFAGSLASFALGTALAKKFSGKGLVPMEVYSSPEFILAVALGAALTVIMATLIGYPISTTQSLVGSLLGTGVMAVGMSVDFAALNKSFFIPLLVSPLIAFVLSGSLYMFFKIIRKTCGLKKEWCLCAGKTIQTVPSIEPASLLSFKSAAMPDVSPNISIDEFDNCYQRYEGKFWGVSLQKLLDTAHFLSAGAVSFARGLNDTPKIIGLLLIVQAFDIRYGMAGVAIAIAIGGLINAKKVATTMSKKITPMSHGQGFTANLVTAFLVIVASKFGIPVSTTHVSVGSIFSIGAVSGKGNPRVIRDILASWVLTLPIAAILSGLIYYIVS